MEHIPDGWTQEDLDYLSDMCLTMTTTYCEHCRVVQINPGDKYCNTCAADIIEWLFQQSIDDLAKRYIDQLRIEGGLY